MKSTLPMPDGIARKALFADDPNSMPIFELIKIENRRILDIMAITVGGEYMGGTRRE